MGTNNNNSIIIIIIIINNNNNINVSASLGRNVFQCLADCGGMKQQSAAVPIYQACFSSQTAELPLSLDIHRTSQVSAMQEYW